MAEASILPSPGDEIEFRVPGPLGHPIRISVGLASRLADGLASVGLGPPRNLLVVSDTAVASFAADVRASLSGAGHSISDARLAAREDRKDLATLDAIWSAALAAGLGRRDAIVAVGGGIVGDVAGFAAATFLRGIPLVAVPTTLLAMVDASCGGKCGINLSLPRGGHGKNLAGAFHAPALVAIDPGVLATLGERDFRSGLAECVKHAILDGEDHLAWIELHAPAILRRDLPTLVGLIARSVPVKAAIVGRDPFEQGERALLNLGHTFGHALETMPELGLTHGEAVGLGLVAAGAAGGSEAFTARIRGLLRGLGLPTRLAVPPDRRRFRERIAFDKKGDRSGPRLVLPRGPGRVDVVPGSEVLLDRGLAELAAAE